MNRWIAAMLLNAVAAAIRALNDARRAFARVYARMGREERLEQGRVILRHLRRAGRLTLAAMVGMGR
jgi:hypothetical protein